MSKIVIDSDTMKRFPSMELKRDGDTVIISFPDVAVLPFLMDYPLRNLDHISWDMIDKIGKAGNARRFFSLGATKKDYMKNGFVAEYRIIGFDHDDLADDSGKAPISWEMARVYKDDMAMQNSDNASCWESCSCRYKLNGEFYNQMSDELRAIIKPVWKMTADSEGNMQRTKDNVWLLSEQEKFGRKIYSNGGEGHWYELFKLEDVVYLYEDDEGNRRWVWLRSPRSSSTAHFCFVNTYGNANGNSSGRSFGVAPGFAS